MNETSISHTPVPERAGTVIPYFESWARPSDSRLMETAGLVEALGCETAFVRTERVREASPSHLLSGGVRQRLAEDLKAEGCTLCVVDGQLTPVQQRNLERDLQIKVIDRTGLILEIFGLRARTKEGRLQVELARILYERSRLVRTWTHLERQRGGSGFLSGPGESQLEADRRMLDDTIKRLRDQLSEVRRTRRLQRAGRKRRETPVVALVGYTNAGKSTLFNRLTGAGVFAKSMPFATLDPTIRAITLPSGKEAAMVDTVGFISDLPVHLVESFQATLEEVVDADLLVHVRDRASPEDATQKADVLEVLSRMETDEEGLPPIIEAWNKADLIEPERADALALSARNADPPAVLVSAFTGMGCEALLETVERALSGARQLVHVRVPPQEGSARAWLHAHGEVQGETAAEDGTTEIDVALSEEALGRFVARFPGLAPG